MLNEVNGEHQMTPQMYTRVYDAIVEAIRSRRSQDKVCGPRSGRNIRKSISNTFLNHKNHKPGIPLDMFSYHFYAVPDARTKLRR